MEEEELEVEDHDSGILGELQTEADSYSSGSDSGYGLTALNQLSNRYYTYYFYRNQKRNVLSEKEQPRNAEKTARKFESIICIKIFLARFNSSYSSSR